MVIPASFFALIGYTILGFLGLIGFVVLFARRVETKWDYEAKFCDARGRELGEFDLDLTRVVDDDGDNDWELGTNFALNHPALHKGTLVEVLLEGVVVMEGRVQRPGRIRLDDRHLQIEIKAPAPGQICAVRVDDAELFAEPLHQHAA